MATYNLDETPDVFITPNFYDNEFEYRMMHITGEGDRKVIRLIDLKSDKLVIYGTEIQESSFKRLYESLVLRPKAGILYVNCNGACYLLLSGKCHRPINNVIFDWSPFGVTIPNSASDSLKKQLEEKEKVINLLYHKLSSTAIQMQSTKKEAEELKEQVLTWRNEHKEMQAKLQEAYQRVALVDFELELSQIELESYKKGEEDFLDQLCSCREESRKLELELKNTQHQLSLANRELQCTKIELETSTKSITVLGYQLSSCRKECQESERKLKRVEEEHSLISLELSSIKKELELSNKKANELEDVLASYKRDTQNIEIEFQNIQNQLCLANHELESSRREVKELKEQSYSYLMEQQFMDNELRKVYDHLSVINSEVMSTNQKSDQLLISTLWMEEANALHRSRATYLESPNLAVNSSSLVQDVQGDMSFDISEVIQGEK